MANLHTYKPLTIINIGMRNKIHDNILCIFHAYYTTWSQLNIRRKGREKHTFNLEKGAVHCKNYILMEGKPAPSQIPDW